MGVVGSLPEDLQWTIRMLLPKPTPGEPLSHSKAFPYPLTLCTAARAIQ